MKKLFKSKTVKTIMIFLMLTALILGSFFSFFYSFKKAKYDSTFKESFTTFINVQNTKKDSEENKNDKDKNKIDIKKAASILYDRLNPMGIKDIYIEIGGNNYLRVNGSKDIYLNEKFFKKEIQRSGSVYFFETIKKDKKTTYKDITIESTRDSEKEKDDKFKKQKLSDLIVSAKATTIQNEATARKPAISFKITKDFEEKFKDDPNNQSKTLNSTILSDVDVIFDTIRFYYLLDSDNKKNNNHKKNNDSKDRIFDDFYKNVIKKLSDIYQNSATSKVLRNSLYDLFYGSYKFKNPSSNTEQIITGSLLNENEIKFEDFKKNYKTWEYKSETLKYIYSPNDDTKSIKQDKIQGYSSNNKLEDIGYVEDVFTQLLNELYGSWYLENKSNLNSNFTNQIDRFLIFNSSISKVPTFSSDGYIQNHKLLIKVLDASTAKIAATIFNAAGAGYEYHAFDVKIEKPIVNTSSFIVIAIVVSIVTLLMLTYIIYVYRILGIFTIIIAMTTTALTLAMNTLLLNLSIGVATSLALIFIFLLSLKFCDLVIRFAKNNVFNNKHGYNTSMNLSFKENAFTIVDIIAMLLIAIIPLFFISTSFLKIFSIEIIIGVSISLLMQFIFTYGLFKLLVSTNIFSSYPFLFVANIEIKTNGEMIQNIKLEIINKRLSKLQNSKSKNKDERILKLEKNKTKIQEKLNLISAKEQKRNEIRERRYLDHLIKLKAKYEKKLTKTKYNFKKNKLIQWIKGIDYVLDQYQSQEQQVIDFIANKTVKGYNRWELTKFQALSNLWIKIISILTVFFMTIGGLFSLALGINFDKSMGGRVEYNLYGKSYIDSALLHAINLAKDEKVSEDFRKKTLEIIDQKFDNVPDEKLTEKEIEKRVKMLSNYFKFAYSRFEELNKYISANINLKAKTIKIDYSTNFTYSILNNVNKQQPCVTISVSNISSSQSREIKKFISFLVPSIKFNESDPGIPNTDEQGFISKRIFISSSAEIIKTAIISFFVALLALSIYIIIRYNWIYFVSLLVGLIILAALLCVGVLGLYIPIGINTIIGFWFVYLLFVTIYTVVFGKIHNSVKSKKESSLNEYFNKEVEFVINLKNLKRANKEEIKNFKNQHKLNLIDHKLKGQEKKLFNKNYKKSLHELKLAKKLEIKNYKETEKEKLLVEARANNYLLTILINEFKENIKKIFSVYSWLIIIFLALLFTSTLLCSMWVPILLGIIISIVVIIFISLPIWLKLSQKWIAHKLARKKFINNIKLKGEEQIVEGIND